MVDPRINDVANLAEAISDARLTKVSSCSAMYVAQVQVYCTNTSILNKYKFTVQAQAQVQVSRFSAVHVVPGMRCCARLESPVLAFRTLFFAFRTLFFAFRTLTQAQSVHSVLPMCVRALQQVCL